MESFVEMGQVVLAYSYAQTDTQIHRHTHTQTPPGILPRNDHNAFSQ